VRRALLLLLSAVTLAGCGGGEKKGERESELLSKEAQTGQVALRNRPA
jgi:hypothetical protein